MEILNIDIDKAKIIVAKNKSGEWYEDYDEAEGIFMGWRKCKNNKIVTEKEFLSFWDKNNSLPYSHE